MPLHGIRKRLRLIRYYSAARPYGRWNRMLDRAMVAALILAWPLTWLLDRSWVTRLDPVTNGGFLYRNEGGMISASTVTTEAIDGQTLVYGAYRIDLIDEEHGWPFVTSLGLREGTINVQLFDVRRTLGAADLPPESPVRAAIENELIATGQGAAAAALWGGVDRAPVSRRSGAWLANGIVWSMALVITAWLLVSGARLAASVVSVRRGARQQRRAQGGRCAGCGYDLRGSTFGERCPECGVLL